MYLSLAISYNLQNYFHGCINVCMCTVYINILNSFWNCLCQSWIPFEDKTWLSWNSGLIFWFKGWSSKKISWLCSLWILGLFYCLVEDPLDFGCNIQKIFLEMTNLGLGQGNSFLNLKPLLGNDSLYNSITVGCVIPATRSNLQFMCFCVIVVCQKQDFGQYNK